jgi:hypothetical protein
MSSYRVPIGTVTRLVFMWGELTSKFTRVGLVTMMPPANPVKSGPHTGSRTFRRDAAIIAGPVELLERP